MDPTQLLLFGVVAVLTALLVIVGVQVFLILREFKKTLEKMNKTMDDINYVSESVTKPISGITHFVEGIRGLREFFDFVSERGSRKSLPAKYQEGEEERGELESLEERGRRFFHKDGKPLTS